MRKRGENGRSIQRCVATLTVPHSHFLTRSNGLSDRGAVCVRDWHALINPVIAAATARSCVRASIAQHDTGVLKRETLVTDHLVRSHFHSGARSPGRAFGQYGESLNPL